MLIFIPHGLSSKAGVGSVLLAGHCFLIIKPLYVGT